MAVCLNCDQNSQQDMDVMSQLSKIRLKTKPLVNHYLHCMRYAVYMYFILIFYMLYLFGTDSCMRSRMTRTISFSQL